jgi:signal peptidase I
VQRPSYIRPTDPFPFKENCRYSAEGVACKVPEGHYFMMGDNRDDSQDSRFWGFLPEAYVKGRALFIYWSFDVPDDGSSAGFAPRWGRLFHQIH